MKSYNQFKAQLLKDKGVKKFYEELKPSVKRRLDRLAKEAREGKNLSPVFESAEEANAYLNSLEKG